MTIRLFDTPVRCGFSFFLLLALFLTADRSGFSAMMLLCILIHEVGHLVGFALAGGEIRSISLTGLGIHIQRGERPVSRSGEACIHLMGPVFSFATALPVLLLWGEQPVGAMFTAISGVLGIFHLLPIGNLDGGNLMRLALENCIPPESIDFAFSFLSFAALVPLFALSVYLFLSDSRNITLLLTCLYLATAIVKE